MVRHHLPSAEQHTPVCDPAAESQPVLTDKLVYRPQRFPVGDHLRKGALEHTVSVMHQARRIQQHLVHLRPGKHLHAGDLHRSLGEQVIRLHQQSVGVEKVVHALITQHRTVGCRRLFRLTLQRQIDCQGARRTAARHLQ